ncbi:uncharacterized protein LOC108864780 [Galendromus occidentalis]|uniref:Uncharacterized protein LOC108864780 n=1 Tax=Galendromus occidentalis TaxID=34638 RepID=A0AAJ7PB14_9ACAR|nr:uncharacterized protein LOC108864780 [Galendromus occidentalis]
MVTSHKFLGLLVDRDLKFNAHANAVSKISEVDRCGGGRCGDRGRDGFGRFSRTFGGLRSFGSGPTLVTSRRVGGVAEGETIEGGIEKRKTVGILRGTLPDSVAIGTFGRHEHLLRSFKTDLARIMAVEEVKSEKGKTLFHVDKFLYEVERKKDETDAFGCVENLAMRG